MSIYKKSISSAAFAAVVATSIALMLFSISSACEIHTKAQTRTYVGESVPIGNGTAKSWVTADQHGNPTGIGVTFTGAALSGLPDAMTEYVIPLPENAPKTAYDQVVMNWNPHGHIPQGVYDIPHFDFHFYTITPDVRDQITATGENLALVQKKADTQYVPNGYIWAPGGEVPHEGAHLVDPNGPEFHGQPFTHTFIYGFYNGRMAFMEPMISVNYLKSKPSFTKDITLPAAYQKEGYYPTKYGLRYAPTKDQYTVALGGLTSR